MVVSSGGILRALNDAIERGVKLTGIYDGPDMRMVEADWDKSAKSAGKLALWQQIKTHLVAKGSETYKDGGLHNFMHNKLVVIDDRLVVTGSFNFSRNATRNSENILTLHDEAIAEQYRKCVDQLVKTYGKG